MQRSTENHRPNNNDTWRMLQGVSKMADAMTSVVGERDALVSLYICSPKRTILFNFRMSSPVAAEVKETIEGDKVTPWEVKAGSATGIDYNKLIR